MWDEEERILRDERAAAWGWKGGRSSAAYSNVKGYGAADIESRNPLLRRPEATDRPHPAIIDYDNERVPDINVHGIRLKWSKAGTAVPRASSSQTSSSRSKGDPKPVHVPDPVTPSSERMPKGAVDLVVEDPEAAVREMEQERRHGEPALEGGTGVKKVYRRKYHQGTSREIEVNEEREVGERPGDLPDKMRVKIREGTESPWGGDQFSPSRETGVTIAREIEPPPRARVELHREHRGLSEDDTNPWA